MRKSKILVIFLVALLVRAILALAQMKYGIDNSINIDQYFYGSQNSGFELYHDFYAYYVPQLVDLSKGFLPYRDFFYQYPPFFLYALFPFYIFGGSHWASIPIWLSDAATAPLVYVIAQHFTSPKLSLTAGLAYAISPFFLLYEGYLWLSGQPMTFLMLLSLYLLLSKRPIWAGVIFAIGVLFRQELVFLTPMYFLWYVKKFPKSILLKVVAISGGIILMASIPFVIVSISGYLSAMSYGVLAHYSVSLDPSSITKVMNSASSSQSITCNMISNTWRSLVCSNGNFSYTDVKLMPPWTVVFNSAFINQASMFFFIPLFGIVSYNLFRLRRDEVSLFLFGCVVLTLFTAIFMVEVHEIYRYYLLPAYVLSLTCSRTRLSMAFAIGIPLLSLLFPSGSVQVLFPLFDVLTILLFNQKVPSGGQEYSTRRSRTNRGRLTRFPLLNSLVKIFDNHGKT
ncbi:MAG: hypothetical protein ACYCQJ_03405 [Nitrososphaerales archaeon]